MYPEGVGVFWGSVEEESYMHISRFSLRGAVKLPSVEGCAIYQVSYISP